MKKIIHVLFILIHFPIDLYEMFVTYLPGRIGYKLRYSYWKGKLKYLGKNVIIDVNVYIQNPKFITLDDNCWIDRNVILIAGNPTGDRLIYDKENPDFPLSQGELYVGKNTHIAPNCVLSGMGGLYIGKNSGVSSNSAIYSFSHHYRNLTDKNDFYQYNFSPMVRMDQQALIRGPVFIDDYCGLGLHTIVLPGVSLKRGTFIGSGAMVTHSYDSQTMVYEKTEINTKSLSHLTIKL